MDGWMDVAVCSLCLTLSAKINILAQLGSSELLRFPPAPLLLPAAYILMWFTTYVFGASNSLLCKLFGIHFWIKQPSVLFTSVCVCVRVMIHGVNVMLVKTAKVLRYIAHFIALSLILSFSLGSQPCKLYAPIRKRGCERDVTHRCCLQQFHHNHSIDFQFAGTQILTCRPAQVEWDRIESERTFAVVGSCQSALPSPF